MKKSRKKTLLITMIVCGIIVASMGIMPASAASTTFNLYTNQTNATGTSGTGYKVANIQYVNNYASSDDGVNMYLDYYDSKGKKYINARHVFVEPGRTYGSKENRKWGEKYAVSANKKTYWRGKMNSWWWNGKNIRATAKFHTYNQ